MTCVDLPAGLNNIGNTCYMNSLLQYYFSLTELREHIFGCEPTTVPDANEQKTQAMHKKSQLCMLILNSRIIAQKTILGFDLV